MNSGMSELGIEGERILVSFSRRLIKIAVARSLFDCRFAALASAFTALASARAVAQQSHFDALSNAPMVEGRPAAEASALVKRDEAVEYRSENPARE
jgi:hypothetical protein